VLGDLDAGGAGLDRLELAAGRFAGLEVPEVDGGGAAARSLSTKWNPGRAIREKPARCLRKCRRLSMG
jgi:hypothetical protein